MPKKELDLRGEVLKLRTEFTPRQVAERFKVEESGVTAVLDTLIQDGFRFVNCDGTWIRTKANEGRINYDASKLFKGGLLHFGLVSDTHLGSKFERLDALEVMYDRFQQAGVHTVFHVGDLTDGSHVYKGQEFEQNVMGQQAQIDYAIKKYPKRSGITTYAIAGNHDLKMYEGSGADPLVSISRARPDIKYIGQYSARVKMTDNVHMDLLHPMGSQAYALSYKGQRMINAMNPEDLPNILATGHYHCSFNMNYRGVDFVQVPCFKDPSLQFEKRLGLTSNIGGWIIEGKSNGEQVRDFNPRLVLFKNNIK
jgi:predicted phosphodiesterase